MRRLSACLLLLGGVRLEAVSTYLGIQPGQSNLAEVARNLGDPLRTVVAGTLEYRNQQGTAPILVEYRAGEIVDRIEVTFLSPVTLNALTQALKLPAAEFRDTRTG